jgi:hypothetical protein
MFSQRSFPVLSATFLLLSVSLMVTGGVRSAFAAIPWTQQTKLTGVATSDRFGYSSGLSSDGNVAITGAISRNSGQGAAYISTRTGTSWAQPVELPDPDTKVDNDSFGYSVALSADGGTALVGAIGKNTGNGTAYVFVLSGNDWVQQSELTVTPGPHQDGFGVAVALSADGNTALVGAIGKGPTAQGKAYLFTRSGSTWTQQGDALTSGGGGSDGDRFGCSVALGADGNTALIGSNGENSVQGKAYVFVRSLATWEAQGVLTAGDGIAGDGFGVSVALGANGSTALIGASAKDSGKGAAYVYTRSAATWAQQGATLTAHDGAALDNFAWAVALSADGNTALMGAVGKTSSQGAAYMFTRTGSVWSEQAVITAADGAAGDNFGYSLAISGDASTAACGAIATNSYTGSLYLFATLMPNVTTAAISDITTTTAAGGGNVTADNGNAVTARGVCWGISAYPTTTDSCSADGTGTGVFTSSITGLSPAAAYHVRAFATNSAGTAYGDDVTFSSAAQLSVTLNGYGTGAVHSSAPDINCSSGTCSRSYPYGSALTLTPAAGERSIFGGWQGSCSDPSGDCILTMDANRAVYATFNIDPAYAVWIDPGANYYDRIGTAYQDASQIGATNIKACRLEITENIDFNMGKSIILSGGYNSSFSDNSGYTTVHGLLTVSTGSVAVNNLIIR